MFEERILRHIKHLVCCNFLLLRLFVDTAFRFEPCERGLVTALGGGVNAKEGL